MKTTIRTIITVALCLTTYLALACYTTFYRQCAWVNETSCTKTISCPNNPTIRQVTAVALQDQYEYPAVYSESGVVGTTPFPGCQYPAVYVGCDNQVATTICGPFGAYATPDFLSDDCNP